MAGGGVLRHAWWAPLAILAFAYPTMTQPRFGGPYYPTLSATLAVEPLREPLQAEGQLRIFRSHTIRSGETLNSILRRWGVPGRELSGIASSLHGVFDIRRLRPGHLLQASFHPEEGRLRGLEYAVDRERVLLVLPTAEEPGFFAHLDSVPLERRIIRYEGRIQGSLYEAAVAAGIPPGLVMDLADVYSCVLDFDTELRDGDHFTILAEAFYDRGRFVKTGSILAATLAARGQVLKAFRYESQYYDETGRSLRRSLLRSPLVRYRRISSRFRYRRVHPITGKKRPHYGVDFSANTGTPIRAAGDGRVIYAGASSGGYGTMVKIRHSSVYTTLYAHMSRLAPNLRSGVEVHQGDVIGYVGQTGLASAPHLHYELHKNGYRMNPLTTELPSADPISSRQRESFERQVRRLWPLLHQDRASLALAGDGEGSRPLSLPMVAHSGPEAGP